MNIGMTVTGAKEIEAMLKRMERKEVSRIARTETREAQKNIMRPAIGSKAMGMVGGKMGTEIAKALIVRAMTKMRRGSYGAKVIIKPTDAFVHFTKGSAFDMNTKKQISGKRHYIPNAIEYGHAGPGKAGTKEKVAAPNPFQRAAYEEKRRPLAEHFAKKVTRAIEQAARVK